MTWANEDRGTIRRKLRAVMEARASIRILARHVEPVKPSSENTRSFLAAVELTRRDTEAGAVQSGEGVQ